MSLYDSSVAYAAIGDDNNPFAIKNYIKPGRILVNNVPPLNTTGELNDYYIDSSSGDLYGAKSDVWGAPVYNFSTGGGGTLTNLENIGEGVQIFKQLNGTVAQLRTITSEGNEINISTDSPIDGSLDFSMSLDYVPKKLELIRPDTNLKVALVHTTFDPNGTLPPVGQEANYPLGSICVQSPATVWVLQTPASQQWIQISGSSGGGIVAINNVGSGAQIFKDITNDTFTDTANLRTVSGTADQIKVETVVDDVIMSMEPTYRPLTLSNILENKRFGFGSLSAPLPTDDQNSGYRVGSLFTEVELGGINRIWICRDATAGAAVWQEFTGSTPIQKDYAQWDNGGLSYLQSIISGTQDVNMGTNIIIRAQAPSSKWSTSFDGTRQIFTRGLVTSAKSYMVTFSCVTLDTAGLTTSDSRYLFSLVRKSDGFIFSQSYNSMVVPAGSQTRHNGSTSFTFLIDEPSTAVQSYYLRVHGQDDIGSGSPGIAPSFSFEHWGLSFKEI